MNEDIGCPVGLGCAAGRGYQPSRTAYTNDHKQLLHRSLRPARLNDLAGSSESLALCSAFVCPSNALGEQPWRANVRAKFTVRVRVGTGADIQTMTAWAAVVVGRSRPAPPRNLAGQHDHVPLGVLYIGEALTPGLVHRLNKRPEHPPLSDAPPRRPHQGS